jgi:uncharacterized integral membrane protein
MTKIQKEEFKKLPSIQSTQAQVSIFIIVGIILLLLAIGIFTIVNQM